MEEAQIEYLAALDRVTGSGRVVEVEVR